MDRPDPSPGRDRIIAPSGATLCTTAGRQWPPVHRGVDIPRLSSPCPALTMLGACSVYDIRPMICRLWGLVEAMACPHGCRPEGGFLDDATALEFVARSLEIGGRPSSVAYLRPETVRELLAEPEVAGYVGAVMRRDRPMPGDGFVYDGRYPVGGA